MGYSNSLDFEKAFRKQSLRVAKYITPSTPIVRFNARNYYLVFHNVPKGYPNNVVRFSANSLTREIRLEIATNGIDFREITYEVVGRQKDIYEEIVEKVYTCYVEFLNSIGIGITGKED